MKQYQILFILAKSFENVSFVLYIWQAGKNQQSHSEHDILANGPGVLDCVWFYMLSYMEIIDPHTQL